MIGSVVAQNLGKGFKQYRKRWLRLLDWLYPIGNRFYKLNWILRDINFTIEKGDAVGIIGGNGSGKSTLLKLIAGVLKPTSGIVHMPGRVAAMLELGMGFHPDFTGRQNVYMAGQLLGMSRQDITKLMLDIISFAEIGDYIDQPLRIYSSGMQVRLAFSVATVIRPDVLIIDEALSVGDGYFQQKCYSRIREFQASGTTLIFVSHDIAALSSFCKRVIWIDSGVIREFGDTKPILELYSKELFKKKQAVSDGSNNFRLSVNFDEGRDARLDFVSTVALRNDIKLIDISNLNQSWGTGAIKILSTVLEDVKGEMLSWVVGGEVVRVVINCCAYEVVSRVIVGFQVKDKYGQILFGDNTYLSTLENPIDMKPDDCLQVVFEFAMPILPVGFYTLSDSVVSGVQQDYVVMEWRDDAIKFESQNSWSNTGLIGQPMREISIKKMN